MKKIVNILTATAFGALLMMLQGCGAMMMSQTLSTNYTGDDMYATHDRVAIRTRIEAEQAAQRRAEEQRRAQMEALVAAADADASIDAILGTTSSGGNSYDAILADDYQSAYERRLRGFSSSTYNMPSSYYNYRFSDAYFYASAYDPTFYNVMVMGDQVWVEPRYITSMFGTWGMPSLSLTLSINPFGPYDSWYWNSLRWHSWYMDPWYRPYNYYFGWYDPWFGYGPWPGYHPPRPPHFGGGSHYPHNPRPPRPAISYRPSYGWNRADSPGTRIDGRGSTTNRGFGGTGESYRRNENSNNRNDSYNRNNNRNFNNNTTPNRGNGGSGISSGSSNRGGFSGGGGGNSGGGGVRSGGGSGGASGGGRTR